MSGLKIAFDSEGTDIFIVVSYGLLLKDDVNVVLVGMLRAFDIILVALLIIKSFVT